MPDGRWVNCDKQESESDVLAGGGSVAEWHFLDGIRVLETWDKHRGPRQFSRALASFTSLLSCVGNLQDSFCDLKNLAVGANVFQKQGGMQIEGRAS